MSSVSARSRFARLERWRGRRGRTGDNRGTDECCGRVLEEGEVVIFREGHGRFITVFDAGPMRRFVIVGDLSESRPGGTRRLPLQVCRRQAGPRFRCGAGRWWAGRGGWLVRARRGLLTARSRCLSGLFAEWAGDLVSGVMNGRPDVRVDADAVAVVVDSSV